MRNQAIVLVTCAWAISCGAASEPSVSTGIEPDWRAFRSSPAQDDVFKGVDGYKPSDGSFVFRDLKRESDSSLAKRLLGAVGERIVYIDRHKDRWEYYDGDDDPIHQLDLYSQPESWGSAYGICRSEKYEISFSDEGVIDSVVVTPRYGVEGPIFQKKDFDWDLFRGAMCERVPANHTPSYFPAGDVLDAQDLAILLSQAVFLAGQSEGRLPFDLSCESYDAKKCSSDPREFLGSLRLSEIDEVSEINCSYPTGPGENCYTVTVGEHRLGPFPKRITVRGSTYMNDWKVHSVSIRESFTIS